MSRNPWIAIMRAACRGDGLRLTAHEVNILSMDYAIEQCAANDVERVDPSMDPINKGWENVDPHKYSINPTIPAS